MGIDIKINIDLSPRQRRVVRGAVVAGAVIGALGVGIAIAAPIDTTWVVTGQTLTAAQLKGNLDGLQAQVTAMQAQLASPVVPPGTVVAFAGPVGSVPPPGWLFCDGRAVSMSTYATLFSAIGSVHGSGDGLTTFNLPDYRGRFLRGTDHNSGRDPDRALRTAANPGGKSADNVGSVEAFATGLPSTSFTTTPAGAHTHTTLSGNSLWSRGGGGQWDWSAYASGVNDAADSLAPAPDHIHSIVGGDAETRPTNSNVDYIIKI